MLLNIITTPVFYVIHTFTYALLNRQENRISKDIHLPLAHAMLSQKEDMCMYFLSLGVCFMDSDSEGNNVFHYMADISAESPDRAIAMFKMLVEFIKDMDSVKALVLNKANTAGLSALEYVVNYGSPALMTEMLQFPNLLRHSVLAVIDNSLTFNVKKEPSKGKIRLSDTSIDYDDVSRYECGSLVHQSSLLNHLSDGSLMMMSPVDLKLFHSTALVGKWMSMKVKQMVAGVVSLHVLDVVFTCFLLLFSLYYPSPNMLLYNRSLGLEDDVFMYEVKSLSENNSFIFKSETYPKVLDNISHNYQGQMINRLDRGMVALLFEKTSSVHPQFGTDWRMKYEGLSYIEAENFPPRLLDAIAETVLSMDECQHVWPEFHVSVYLRNILVSFSQSVLHISRRFAYDEYLDHFYQLKASNGEVSFSVSTVLKWTEFKGFICIANRYFVSSDVNGSTAGMDLPYYGRDSCCYKALLDFAAHLANNCSKGELSAMYDRITSATFAQDDVLHFSKIFFVTVLCFCVIYLVLDLYERC